MPKLSSGHRKKKRKQQAEQSAEDPHDDAASNVWEHEPRRQAETRDERCAVASSGREGSTDELRMD